MSTTSSFASRFLDRVERAGNRLPHPTTLFVFLSLFIIAVSWLAATLSVSAVHPVSGDNIEVFSLVSGEGLRKILTHMVTNFTGFAPLGTVLVAMLGIGIAEYSGLISTLLRQLVLSAPPRLLTFFVVFAGILSSLAADAGYVVLIPLAGLVFISANRHPIAGITAAFAGVAGGFSANLMIGPVDAILSGISTEAIALVNPAYEVNAASNLYFIIASSFYIAIIGAWITEKLVEPRLGQYQDSDGQEVSSLTHGEYRGLRFAGITALILGVLILLCTYPDDAILRNAETGSILKSPFMSGVVTIIAFFIGLCGLAYGLGSGTIKNDHDVIKSMEVSMATMASYLVLMFFAAQFVNYFAWTNLGLISAISGSEWLKTLQIGPVALITIFILFSASINLVIGSASAKWSIMAPIFVPMFYLLGISPEVTQAAYRVGDSSTNIITPLMPYFAIVVAFVAKYDSKAGIGTIIAAMLPYSIIFLISWTALFGIWISLDIPLGPGGSTFVTPAL
ncbi:MAG: aminobenzoyl-glutamate transporter [Gammaproteobacteria bacterium]|nr:MAG: aminobenzoyl-glutamate transporter [Gammaproteobacteria bacterium]